VKPIDSNISPYLQQPLRTFEQVLEEREQRQRQQAARTPGAPAATAVEASPERALVSAKQVDQTV
jgi:hypothetical protein